MCNGWRNAPYDTQCGLKFFRVDYALVDSLSGEFQTSWFFDVELLLRLSHGSLEVWEEPLQYWHDVQGSKIRLRAYPTILVEILRTRRLIARHLRSEV